MRVHLRFWRRVRGPHLRSGPRCSVAAHSQIGVTHNCAFLCPILELGPTVSLSLSWSPSHTPCNGNHSANVKLLKLGSVMGIQVASFRNACEISELCSGIRSGRYLNAIC